MNQLREALLDPEAYLMKSPPIAPARSIAPGEAPATAAQVAAYAASQQKTRIGTGSDLPLPPAQASQAKTIIPTGEPRRSTTHAVPEMQPPAVPKMNTMVIATPLGYSSRPPRKVWPIVLVAGLLLGLGGGAFAVAWFGRTGHGAASAAEAGTPPAGSAVAVTPVHADAAVVAPPLDAAAVTPPADAAVAMGKVDAAVAAARFDAAVAVAAKPDAGVPAKTVTVVIDSSPQGAEVFGPDRKLLGKTPARLTLPIGDAPRSFELRLAGYKRKTYPVVVSGNTVVNIPLEKAPVVIHTHPHKGSGHHPGEDDLERPE
jgi:hypothetical protein